MQINLLTPTAAPAPRPTPKGQPRMRTVLDATLLIGLILGAAEARGQLVPIPLDYQRVGNEVVLSWTNAAFSLQSGPSVQGTFTNVPGATSPYTNALSGVQAYFRLLGVDTPAGMALIPAGSFTMGNCMDPNEGWSDELPLHTVYVSAFYMDRYEVTKALWDEVKAWNGGNGYTYDDAGSGKAADHPVQTINWQSGKRLPAHKIHYCRPAFEKNHYRQPSRKGTGGDGLRYSSTGTTSL